MISAAKTFYSNHLRELFFGLIIGLGAFGTLLSIIVYSLCEAFSLRPFHALEVMGVMYFLLPALTLNLLYGYYTSKHANNANENHFIRQELRPFLFLGSFKLSIIISFLFAGNSVCLNQCWVSYFILIIFLVFFLVEIVWVTNGIRHKGFGCAADAQETKYHLLFSSITLILGAGLALCLKPWLIYDSWFAWCFIGYFFIAIIFAFWCIFYSGNNSYRTIDDSPLIIDKGLFEKELEEQMDNAQTQSTGVIKRILGLNEELEYLKRDVQQLDSEIKSKEKELEEEMIQKLKEELINELKEELHFKKEKQQNIEELIDIKKRALELLKKKQKGYRPIVEKGIKANPNREHQWNVVVLSLLAFVGLFFPFSIIKNGYSFYTLIVPLIVVVIFIFSVFKSKLIKKKLMLKISWKFLVLELFCIFTANFLYQGIFKSHNRNNVRSGHSQTLQHYDAFESFKSELNLAIGNEEYNTSTQSKARIDSSELFLNNSKKLAEGYQDLYSCRIFSHPLNLLDDTLDKYRKNVESIIYWQKQEQLAEKELLLAGYGQLDSIRKVAKELDQDVFISIISKIRGSNDDSIKKMLSCRIDTLSRKLDCLLGDTGKISITGNCYCKKGRDSLANIASFIRKNQCALAGTTYQEICKQLDNLREYRSREFDDKLRKAQGLLVYEVNDYMNIGAYLFIVIAILCILLWWMNRSDRQQGMPQLIPFLSMAVVLTLFVVTLLLLPLLKEVTKSDIDPDKPFFGLFSFQNWYVPNAVKSIVENGPERRNYYTDNRIYNSYLGKENGGGLTYELQDDRVISQLQNIHNEIKLTREMLRNNLKIVDGGFTSISDGTVNNFTMNVNPCNEKPTSSVDLTTLLSKMDNLLFITRQLSQDMDSLYLNSMFYYQISITGDTLKNKFNNSKNIFIQNHNVAK